MPKCPICGSEVTPDQANPGKYLCYSCKKRIPGNRVVPDEAGSTYPGSNPQEGMPAQQQQFQQPQGQFQDQSQFQQPQPQPHFQQQGQFQPQGQPQQQQQWQQDAQQVQQSIASQGGGLFSNLFAMPDKMRVMQVEQAGQGMNWYKALVYVLLFLSAAGSVITAIQYVGGIATSLRYGMPVAAIFSVINAILQGGAVALYLVIRKRLALFAKGSGQELSAVTLAYSAIVSVLTVLTSIFGGGIAVLGSVVTAVLALGISAVVAYLNGTYFAKRNWAFTNTNPAMGCAPFGSVADRVDAICGRAATQVQQMQQGMPQQQMPQQQMPQQPAPQQQWQQGGYPQQQMPQQQWQQGGYEQPQQPQQW